MEKENKQTGENSKSFAMASLPFSQLFFFLPIIVLVLGGFSFDLLTFLYHFLFPASPFLSFFFLSPFSALVFFLCKQ